MENTLNIQITVNDEQMTSLIKGHLEELSDEKLQEIFGNALAEFMKTNCGQQLFYKKDYYSSDPKPTDLLIKMVDNAISKDLLKPAVDEFVNTIKCKYPELIKSAIVDTFTNLFFTELKSVDLKNAIYQMIKPVNI